MNENETENAAGDWIVSVDAKDFEKDVIERSKSIPVLVDFWAEWCGPCKELGPLLEKKAREDAGRFVLAKVDVDRNQELTQIFRIQGIPAVLALVDGKLADGFQGALPEPELDAFLERIAPRQAPATESAILDRARSLAAEGQAEEAIAQLRNHLREKPDHAPGRLLLAELLVDADRAPEAEKVFAKLSDEAQGSAAGRALKARLDFAGDAGDLEELAGAVAAAPDDAEARIALGKARLAAQQYEEGLEELLEAVRLDPHGSGTEAKEAMLEVFDVLGLEDPVANDYRFKLSLELFA